MASPLPMQQSTDLWLVGNQVNYSQVEVVHNCDGFLGRIYVYPSSQVYDIFYTFAFSLKTRFHSFSGFCPELSQISNGQVIETRPNIGQAAVEFRCNGKFRLVGTPRLECIDGRWNGKLPFCESKLSR